PPAGIRAKSRGMVFANDPRMRTPAIAFAASIILAVTSARADDVPEKKVPLSQPTATAGLVLVAVGVTSGVVGTVGWIGDGVNRFAKTPLFCFSTCSTPRFDNTPRDVFGAMALAGAGGALFGATLYFIGSSTVSVSPTVGGAMVHGTF